MKEVSPEQQYANQFFKAIDLDFQPLPAFVSQAFTAVRQNDSEVLLHILPNRDERTIPIPGPGEKSSVGQPPSVLKYSLKYKSIEEAKELPNFPTANHLRATWDYNGFKVTLAPGEPLRISTTHGFVFVGTEPMKEKMATPLCFLNLPSRGVSLSDGHLSFIAQSGQLLTYDLKALTGTQRQRSDAKQAEYTPERIKGYYEHFFREDYSKQLYTLSDDGVVVNHTKDIEIRLTSPVEGECQYSTISALGDSVVVGFRQLTPEDTPLLIGYAILNPQLKVIDVKLLNVDFLIGLNTIQRQTFLFRRPGKVGIISTFSDFGSPVLLFYDEQTKNLVNANVLLSRDSKQSASMEWIVPEKQLLVSIDRGYRQFNLLTLNFNM